MTHSDGGKGSARRNEDVSKVKSNWDLIDWSVKTQEEPKMNEHIEEHDDDEDGYEICHRCNGSGEGMYDGSRCGFCHGTGEVQGEKEFDDGFLDCDDDY